jgi:hypothetical protein
VSQASGRSAKATKLATDTTLALLPSTSAPPPNSARRSSTT